MTEEVKGYKTYAEQVALLASRGMDVGDAREAERILERVNYYRLSGYWYPFREVTDNGRSDNFYEGTRLSDVMSLYTFDAHLRAAAFSALMPVELAIRALLGHELGRVHPCAHLEPALLGPTARQGDQFADWLERYERELSESREEFVDHHRTRYGGRLPVWAATELLDWGGLTRLYGFAPRSAQDEIADLCGLTSPQLRSWLKTLNLIRNACAHNRRLYNRVHTLTPKLPPPGVHPGLDAVAAPWNRTFAQLSLLQFLGDRLGTGRSKLLPAAVGAFPLVQRVPMSHMGVPDSWRTRSDLWS